ncbi:OLC1v1033180C1 [Oldenlandia corymbosa var. corymbosa]|uniref:non-specific serine/threonine protein kinase n=1 Tax=Oldenlandia corymbosa var. corymbosa TaxID=529605 RepID=A0AAV1CP27_OLDCO|nr:OLC1v1033180C1 [Oldenlandia corymbosa var. corymbosa]
MSGLEAIWLMVLFYGFFSLPSALGSLSPAGNLTCNQDDMKALVDFYHGLDLGSIGGIPTWDVNSSSSNCCNWVGITCLNDSSTGDSSRVVKFELTGKRLIGKLPESMGNLDQLRTLNLSRNFLRGSIPLTLLHLPNLEVIDLSFNDFIGPIPASISLPSLRVFNISENSFSGSVPVGICSNSTRIQAMKMGANYFSGNLAPGVGNCSSSLEELCLASNLVSGSLPEEMFQLNKLSRLTLQDNRFSGNLSDNIGNLSSLRQLDLSMNNFSGSLPDIFHNLGFLNYFAAQSNKFSGSIPLSLASSPSIAFLTLRNNSLGNILDLNCSAMVSLVALDLGTNQFSGSIPANLPDCPQLKTINLARNNLKGQVPESFKNFQTLSYLSLSNSSISNLSSALATLQHCRNLTSLILTLNFHDEELPSDSTLHFGELKALVIANCRLTGTIPLWLSNSKKLQVLDLSWNRLEGKIPSWFGEFQFLFYLDLSNNSFSGEIPVELTELESLIHGKNSADDPYPEFPLFLKRNVSSGGLQYNQIFSLPPTLELGNNFLTGSIWPEFGRLKYLIFLDLKCNNLSGIIPSNLSSMTNLETLDLSNNSLSGSIPPSLVKLNFLSRFSVAYNKLSGAIPNGGQFVTFPSSSFEGNLGLCGNHSSPCPDSNQLPRKSFRKEKTTRGSIIGMALGISLGTVSILALVLVVVLRSGRKARKAIDPEELSHATRKDSSELGSSLVILFQNKDKNREISLEELVNSTNNFDQSNIIGCGGFGLVYRATLFDGRKVAVKRLCGDGGQMDREFHAEVQALSRAQHPNLVLLQGYCSYKNDRILIYSYMENGSLDFWLHEKTDGPSSLDWVSRLRIAQGAARGLAYLHESCEPHILHRDIKSSNILLDENFEAHLADFGLARLILPYDTHITTDLVGTLGYIPPEYGQASVATYKGDVYSFGVVLLELLTGRRPMDMCKPRGARDLVSYVFQMKRDRRASEVIDPFIYDKQHAEEILCVLEIACLCLSEFPKARPTTQQLVSWLENIHSKSCSDSC